VKGKQVFFDKHLVSGLEVKLNSWIGFFPKKKAN
jgi:hypothetical protein